MELSNIDEFDAIILGKLTMQFLDLKDFMYENEIAPKNLLKFGVNEIARMVERDMAYTTALNHTQKLLKEGFLIDVNQIILKKIDEIIEGETTDNELDDIALIAIKKDLTKIKRKYQKGKKMLMVNFDKFDEIKTSTS